MYQNAIFEYNDVHFVVETKNITDRNFIVEAAVDFDNLETVLVITNQ